MHNKLVFPNRNPVLTYRWDQFYSVLSYTNYTWKKYNVDTWYYWNRYTVKTVPYYGYLRYEVEDMTPYGNPGVYKPLTDTQTTVHNISLDEWVDANNHKYNGPRGDGSYGTCIREAGISSDGYAYMRQSAYDTTTEAPDRYVNQTSSTNQSLYPTNGKQGDYWYIYDHNEQTKGSWVQNVTSTTRSTYPDNGIQDGYWYVYQSSTDYYVKGDSTGVIVTSASVGAYPANGRKESDGFWYVEKDVISDNFKIEDNHLYSGCKYSIDINTESDFCPGTVASAQLTFETDKAVGVGEEFKYYKKYQDTDNWTFVDNFIISEVIKTPQENYYKVTAYDYISLFDMVVDDWITALPAASTLTGVYQSLIQYVSTQTSHTMTWVSTNIGTNSSLTVLKGFSGSNITGRQILGYIAQLAGRYIKTTSTDGNIKIDCPTWNTQAVSSTVANRKSVEISEDYVQCPTKVIVKSSTTDIGGISGVGTATYEVTGNPLVNGAGASTLTSYAAGIITEMTPVNNFSSGTLKMLTDYDYPVGTLFNVYNKNNSLIGIFLSMHKEYDNTGVTYKCDGLPVREVQSDATNSQIQALIGKYNSIKDTVDEHTQEIGDLETGVSTLQQTTTAIQASVTALDGRTSSLELDTAGIRTTVTGQGSRLTAVEQTASELEIRIEQPTTSVTTTTGFTFNEDGLTVSRSSSDITTTISEDGMTINEGSQDVLVANSDGVDAWKLKAKKYIIIADLIHLEEYDGNKIGCFWVGE